jgi:DNA-binding transcriptional LysR family regulator
VVETGSFTAAAQALQTAKSSVSETVRAREERMGVRLLDRTIRSVRLTEAGAAFYRHCRRLIGDMDSARREAQAAHKTPAGRLRIAVADAFAERYIVPGLPAFLASHPTIEIELVEATVAARLLDEGIDLAIRIVEKPEANLVVRRIATSRVIIVGSPAYLAQHGAPQRPRDVLGHRLVGFTPLAWRHTWQLGKETVRVRPNELTNSSSSLRAAALAGLGLTALPEWLVADARVSGQLTRVLTACEPSRSASMRCIRPTACSRARSALSSTLLCTICGRVGYRASTNVSSCLL